ncbi:MAG: DEAD/DEAH box helicase, partial [Saprospiraceae bacterium]
FRVAGVYGGTNINTQGKAVRDGLDLLVATPGRLLDLALNGVLKMKQVKKLVIDEVDEMFNLGFRPQLFRIMDLLSEKRQNIMFSATLSETHEPLIQDHFNYPQKIEIAPHGTPLGKIEQLAYRANNFNTKTNLLAHIIADESMKKVLVFVGNKKRADWLVERMVEQFEAQIGVIHANKSQNYRLNALEKFRAGEHRVLIATDIMARGLDIHGVSHVINFDLPETPGDYLHRIGRTGRAEEAGVAISLVAEAEEEYQLVVEDLMKLKITMLDFPETVEVSEILLPSEKERLGGDKNYLQMPSMNSRGAYHEKKEKNKKVNRAEEKRRARRLEKKRSGRKKKKS